jgi:hypothetical protein
VFTRNRSWRQRRASTEGIIANLTTLEATLAAAEHQIKSPTTPFVLKGYCIEYKK